MAKKVRIELNSAGVQELLHECGETICYELAEKARNKCGDGYDYDMLVATKRTVASVYTDTPEAMVDNMKNNTILKALK